MRGAIPVGIGIQCNVNKNKFRNTRSPNNSAQELLWVISGQIGHVQLIDLVETQFLGFMGWYCSPSTLVRARNVQGKRVGAFKFTRRNSQGYLFTRLLMNLHTRSWRLPPSSWSGLLFPCFPHVYRSCCKFSFWCCWFLVSWKRHSGCDTTMDVQLDSISLRLHPWWNHT